MNSTANKFDELDRKVAIERVQELYGVRLRKARTRKKWLRDKSGVNWVILGGKDDWHGIPPEIMEDELQAQNGGMLVFAQKKLTRIKLFGGSLRPMVEERSKLSRAHRSGGDYQFTVESWRKDLRCVQIRRCVLTSIDSIPWTPEIREAYSLLTTMFPDWTLRRLMAGLCEV